MMPKFALQSALQIANEVHWRQLDKTGQPYILHPIRVMQKMTTIEEQIVALLHDVVEDGPDQGLPADDLRDQIFARFGVEVGDAVVAITHRPNEQLDDYYERVRANVIALTVKRSDVIDNYGRLYNIEDVPTRKRLKEKYEHAMAVL